MARLGERFAQFAGVGVARGLISRL
jgi:hypothetical protein